MKHYKLIIILCFFSVTLIGCSTTEPPLKDIEQQYDEDREANTNREEITNTGNTNDALDENIGGYEYTKNGSIDSKTAETTIKTSSDQVISLLKDQDMAAISKYVHPTKGVRFTPYTFVNPGTDIVFKKDEMEVFFDDANEYTWGTYAGYGEVIELTPSQYYQEFIYSHDFVNADRIGYNTILSGGNTLTNQFEAYINPIVVEYYFPGFDPQMEGLDWVSLRLVFEEYQGSWYLVGIIHNRNVV